MNYYLLSDLDSEERRRLSTRGDVFNGESFRLVGKICRNVKQQGDTALLRYTERFDGVRPERLRISDKEIADACRAIEPRVYTAIATAAATIKRFHAVQAKTEESVWTAPGVRCWREPRAIERVGLYIPAGSAPLPSTVLMLGIPAVLAGCKSIMLCSPPRGDGSVDPHVLAAAHIVGLTELYAIGGAQAIAAMAYGTESIPKVDKVFGPGNRYVTAAKQYVASDPDGAAIDLLAGPSELLVVADATADPVMVATDLVSQAEHDPDAHVALLTDCEPLARDVCERVDLLSRDLPRRSVIERSLHHGFVLVTCSLEESLEFANDYGPEHLTLNVADPERAAAMVRNAGSVFLGAYAPVTAGDYASGTNHTLPTGGSARWSGGVSVESFRKMISFQSITLPGLRALAPTLLALARAEGLEAHARAVLARTEEGAS